MQKYRVIENTTIRSGLLQQFSPISFFKRTSMIPERPTFVKVNFITVLKTKIKQNTERTY